MSTRWPGPTSAIDANALIEALGSGIPDYSLSPPIGVLSRRFQQSPNHTHDRNPHSPSAGMGRDGGATMTSGELSGAAWVNRFPKDSPKRNDLEKNHFRPKVDAFIKAMETAEPKIVSAETPHSTNFYKILSVWRNPKRAYLMRWSWLIVHPSHHHPLGLSYKNIPREPGVPIIWWHGNESDSIKAAEKMVKGFGIDPKLTTAPAHPSLHETGQALDMSIAWAGTLEIRRGDRPDQTVTIMSQPRNHLNVELMAIAATYGVKHFVGRANARALDLGPKADFESFRSAFTRLHEAAKVDAHHWSVNGC